MKEAKEQFKVTIDVMLIIGKYFRSNNDYINIMKIVRKYRDLVQMYHFNPISDYSLFVNMETQCFYEPSDKAKMQRGMSKYVHWYPVSFALMNNDHGNEIYKRFELKSVYSLS